MPTPLRYVLTGLIIVLMQWFILGRLRVWGAYPDLVLLYVGWIALHHGRLPGMISGFTGGFFMDLLYGTWGIHMFVKTITGFLVGLFPAAERETLLIQPQQAFVGSLVIALLHNGIQVIILSLQAGTRNTFLIGALWLGSALYTAVVGFIISLFATR